MPEEKIKENYVEENLRIKKFYLPVFIFVLILIVGLGMVYVWNFDKGFTNKMLPVTYEPIKIEKEIPKAEGKITAGADLQKVGMPNAELIAKGKELFKTNCSSCHGENGLGDGPGAAALNPKPRNFTQKEGWKNGRDLISVFKTLEEGIPNSGMTSYQFLPVEDRLLIIHYVMTFAPDFPPVTKEVLAQMDAVYSVSKGKMTPNTIPVSLAVQKMIDEAKPVLDKIVNLEKEIKESDNAGAKLFCDYTKCKTRALASLLNNSTWKESKARFFRIVYNSLPENGFKRCVLKLDETQQNELYNYLKGKI